MKRIAEKHDKQSAEGRCAHKVSELRLEATPDIDHEDPALNVLMILEELELPNLPKGTLVDDARVDELIATGRGSAADAVHRATDPVSKREAWIALAECWIKPSVDLAPTVDGVGSVVISVLNGEELFLCPEPQRADPGSPLPVIARRMSVPHVDAGRC